MGSITFEGQELETEQVPCDLCGGTEFRPFGNLAVVAVKADPMSMAAFTHFDIESFSQRLVELDRVKLLATAIPKLPLLSKIRGTLTSI